jgi:uncharacterized protein DUF5872
MSKTAERTNPKLWEEVKAEVKEGEKGGKAGEWSARKAQLAVQEYKKRGGGYKGGKSKDNALTQWTEEKWGTKSGTESRETGERYLPQQARDHLSDEEYRATSEKKRDDTRKGEQFSSQPREIAIKTARYRHPARPHGGGGRSKADLLREAKQLDIGGRSRMSKEELTQAIRYAKH